MPEHKMITIDGVRVRPEDVNRYRARTAAGTGPLTQAHAEPTAPPAGFSPGAQGVGVDDVVEYLATADEAETERVLDAEAAEGGKQRKSLLDQREALLAQARERASGGGA